MKNNLLILLFSTILLSCNSGYKRDDNCDLDKLNLKGNVVKLELISQTTIPISEWLYTSVSSIDLSRSCRENAVYSFM